MRYTDRPAYPILKEWADTTDQYVIAYPVRWDGMQTLVCRRIPMSIVGRTLSTMDDDRTRAAFAIYVLGAAKRDTRRRADEAGVHVAL